MGKFNLSKFAEALPKDVPDSGTTQEIPVDDIFDNPRNFYPQSTPQALAALVESIQVNGLLEPPAVVTDENGKYRLISGHSRMAAIRSLYLSDRGSSAPTHRWDTVLCRVLPTMTPEQEECAVIEANRQRIKSPALLAQEAERLRLVYLRRKEAGEELPCGLREWIAQKMQVSGTKVGNLQIIRNKVAVPGILRRWEAGDLPEAAALEIAKLDHEEQYRLLDYMLDGHRPWTIKSVKAFLQESEAAGKAVETGEPQGEERENVRCVRCGAAWYSSNIEPAEGQHIIFVDDTGTPDEGVFRGGCVEELNDWTEVSLWTPYPHAPQAVPESDTAPEWRTGTPPREGKYYCRFDCGGEEVYQNAHWDNVLCRWCFGRGGVEVEAECLGWWPLLERMMKEDET